MQRRTFLAFVAAVALAACSNGKATQGGDKAGNPANDLQRLTVDEVATKIAANDGKTFVYDNNVKESWQKAHVPGAKWLDDENVTAADLPADKTATLIFYCHNES